MSTVRDGQYVGRLKAARQVAGITLAETSYAASLIVPAHAHESALCSVILEGSMTEERGSRKVGCDAGTLIFQPPDEPHAHRFHEHGGRCFVIQFGTAWSARMGELGVSGPGAPLDLRRSRANWVAAQIHREFGSADTASNLAIEGFALALIGEVARSRAVQERGARPGWLIRLMEILHTRFQENLALADLAEAVGVHPTHLARTFQQFNGCSLGEYLRRLRVDHARHELAQTEKPLSRIALEAGFSDQPHFSRVFKGIIGVTPGAYRREARAR